MQSKSEHADRVFHEFRRCSQQSKRQTDRQESEKKAAEQTAEATQKQENCQRARASLAQLEAGGRLSRFNAKGEREYLGEDELAQEKGRNQALVQQWCK